MNTFEAELKFVWTKQQMQEKICRALEKSPLAERDIKRAVHAHRKDNLPVFDYVMRELKRGRQIRQNQNGLFELSMPESGDIEEIQELEETVG